jgi:hypothetical protein
VQQSLVEKSTHMLVVQGVKDFLALAAVTHQARLPQHLKMMRDGWLGKTGKDHQFPHPGFPDQKSVDYP